MDLACFEFEMKCPNSRFSTKIRYRNARLVTPL
jgi:hypothetical protein